MHISYTPPPDEGDPQEWEFDPGRVRASVAEMIERRFGENYDAWQAGVQSGNMRARRVLLWHLLTLEHPRLRYEEVRDFYADEVKVQFSVTELTAIRDRLQRANLSEDKREQALAAVDLEMTEAIEREEGKAQAAAQSAS